MTYGNCEGTEQLPAYEKMQPQVSLRLHFSVGFYSGKPQTMFTPPHVNTASAVFFLFYPDPAAPEPEIFLT